jgi:hypothetical protein
MPIQGSRLYHQNALAIYNLIAAGHIEKFKETIGSSLADLRDACVMSAQMWHGVAMVKEALANETGMEDWTTVEHFEGNAGGKSMTSYSLIVTVCAVGTVDTLYRV